MLYALLSSNKLVRRKIPHLSSCGSDEEGNETQTCGKISSIVDSRWESESRFVTIYKQLTYFFLRTCGGSKTRRSNLMRIIYTRNPIAKQVSDHSIPFRRKEWNEGKFQIQKKTFSLFDWNIRFRFVNIHLFFFHFSFVSVARKTQKLLGNRESPQEDRPERLFFIKSTNWRDYEKMSHVIEKREKRLN